MSFKSHEPCRGEGCNCFYIQNKRKHLCSNCIYKDNHNGRTQQEVYNERTVARVVKLNLKRGLKEGPSKEAQEFSRALKSTGLVFGSSDEEIMFMRNKAAQDAITDIDEEGEKKFFEKENKHLSPEAKELHEAMDSVSGWVGGDPKPGVVYTPVDLFPKKKQKAIKQKSKKQSEIDFHYKAVCADMDYTTEPVCTGCLKYQGGDIKLSHSHIISRTDCHAIGKPELIYEKRILTYHCMDFGENIGCHRKWENPAERKTLQDYENNIRIVKEFAPELLPKYEIS